MLGRASNQKLIGWLAISIYLASQCFLSAGGVALLKGHAPEEQLLHLTFD